MKQYIVDTFTDKIFAGNPAAICVMNHWLPDELMMQITAENNLSETAFAVKENENYKLRWFTLAGEIDLCGHATLACAYVILNDIEKKNNSVVFDTLSGQLTVSRQGDIYEMDFPAYNLVPLEITQELTDAIGTTPKEFYIGRDLLCIFDDESIVRKMNPDLEKIKNLDGLLLHVTAPGKDTDCISRTFAPKCHVPEDPVCGSGHCHIVPYWSNRLHKNKIVAYQASKRGGTLYCRMDGDRVILGGKATIFSIADIFITKG